jgi:hypothetical protein
MVDVRPVEKHVVWDQREAVIVVSLMVDVRPVEKHVSHGRDFCTSSTL